MNMRMILFWAVLQIPITGYCSEWIYVTRDTMGDEFFVDRASFEQDEYKIFYRGLRNYSSPEKRFGSFSSVGKFEADCQTGGYGYINLIICREKWEKAKLSILFRLPIENGLTLGKVPLEVSSSI